MKEWIKLETALLSDPRIERLVKDLGTKGLGIYIVARILTDQNDKGCMLKTLLNDGSYFTSRRLIYQVVDHYGLFARNGSGLLRGCTLVDPRTDVCTREGDRADAPEDTRTDIRAGEPLCEEEDRYRNKNRERSGHAPTPLSDEEKNFYEHMQANYPRVCMLDKPLTYAESERLLKDYSPEQIHSALMDMENNKNLLKKSISANLTCRKYLRVAYGIR